MTDFIVKALAERTLGMALHYPFLHAAVLGLNATRTLEFGAGGSTRVFLDALPADGEHASLSTEAADQIRGRYGVVSAGATWIHCRGKSEEYRSHNLGPLDLILHDGSHAADVVAADIAWAWPYLKRYGLLLVHDTQHSYCGAEVREGVRRGLAAAGANWTTIGRNDLPEPAADYSMTTLPYGFGLTIIRRERGGPGEVVPAVAKATSGHGTTPVAIEKG